MAKCHKDTKLYHFKPSDIFSAWQLTLVHVQNSFSTETKIDFHVER